MTDNNASETKVEEMKLYFVIKNTGHDLKEFLAD